MSPEPSVSEMTPVVELIHFNHRIARQLVVPRDKSLHVFNKRDRLVFRFIRAGRNSGNKDQKRIRNDTILQTSERDIIASAYKVNDF